MPEYDENKHVWLGTVLSDDDPIHQRAFPSRRDAMRWVEQRLHTEAKWSGDCDDDARVVIGVEATDFEDPPGKVVKIPVSSPGRVTRKWGCN